MISPNAYVLFYSKTTVKDFYRQSTSKPENWPHIINDMKGKSSRGSKESLKNKDHSKRNLSAKSISLLQKHTYNESIMNDINISHSKEAGFNIWKEKNKKKKSSKKAKFFQKDNKTFIDEMEKMNIKKL